MVLPKKEGDHGGTMGSPMPFSPPPPIAPRLCEPGKPGGWPASLHTEVRQPDAAALCMDVGSTWCAEPRTGSSSVPTVARVCDDGGTGAVLRAVFGRTREGPANRLDSLEVELPGQRSSDLKLDSRRPRGMIDDLRQHLLAAEGDEDLRAARQHGMPDAEGGRPDHHTACRSAAVRPGARRRQRAIPRCACLGDGAWHRRFGACRTPGTNRERGEYSQQGDSRKCHLTLCEGETHRSSTAAISSENDSRTSGSKSVGSNPSGLAKSRR